MVYFGGIRNKNVPRSPGPEGDWPPADIIVHEHPTLLSVEKMS